MVLINRACHIRYKVHLWKWCSCSSIALSKGGGVSFTRWVPIRDRAFIVGLEMLTQYMSNQFIIPRFFHRIQTSRRSIIKLFTMITKPGWSVNKLIPGLSQVLAVPEIFKMSKCRIMCSRHTGYGGIINYYGLGGFGIISPFNIEILLLGSIHWCYVKFWIPASFL